jgi:hypothetical protein
MHQTIHALIPLRPRPSQLCLAVAQHRAQLDIPRLIPAIRLQRDRPPQPVLRRRLPVVFRLSRCHDLVRRQPGHTQPSILLRPERTRVIVAEVSLGLLRDANVRAGVARGVRVRPVTAHEPLLRTLTSTRALLLFEAHLTFDRTWKEYLYGNRCAIPHFRKE